MWECSIDLTEYLASRNIAFRGLKVLEVCFDDTLNSGFYNNVVTTSNIFHAPS